METTLSKASDSTDTPMNVLKKIKVCFHHQRFSSLKEVFGVSSDCNVGRIETYFICYVCLGRMDGAILPASSYHFTKKKILRMTICIIWNSAFYRRRHASGFARI